MRLRARDRTIDTRPVPVPITAIEHQHHSIYQIREWVRTELNNCEFLLPLQESEDLLAN